MVTLLLRQTKSRGAGAATRRIRRHPTTVGPCLRPVASLVLCLSLPQDSQVLLQRIEDARRSQRARSLEPGQRGAHERGAHERGSQTATSPTVSAGLACSLQAWPACSTPLARPAAHCTASDWTAAQRSAPDTRGMVAHVLPFSLFPSCALFRKLPYSFVYMLMLIAIAAACRGSKHTSLSSIPAQGKMACSLSCGLVSPAKPRWTRALAAGLRPPTITLNTAASFRPPLDATPAPPLPSHSRLLEGHKRTPLPPTPTRFWQEQCTPQGQPAALLSLGLAFLGSPAPSSLLGRAC